MQQCFHAINLSILTNVQFDFIRFLKTCERKIEVGSKKWPKAPVLLDGAGHVVAPVRYETGIAVVLRSSIDGDTDDGWRGHQIQPNRRGVGAAVAASAPFPKCCFFKRLSFFKRSVCVYMHVLVGAVVINLDKRKTGVVKKTLSFYWGGVFSPFILVPN